jgi:ankyrin repeat protein
MTWDNSLLIAIYNGNNAMANTLLDVGADPKHSNGDGENALQAAVRTRKLDIVKRLVEEFNMDVNEKDSREYTSLHLAVINDDMSMAEYLLSKNADPTELAGNDLGDRDDLTYDTTLHLVKNDNVQMARMLIKAGAKINRENSEMITPLYWACCRNYTNLALYLISKKAKASLRCDQGYTVLDIAREHNMTEVINKLVG